MPDILKLSLLKTGGGDPCQSGAQGLPGLPGRRPHSLPRQAQILLLGGDAHFSLSFAPQVISKLLNLQRHNIPSLRFIVAQGQDPIPCAKLVLNHENQFCSLRICIKDIIHSSVILKLKWVYSIKPKELNMRQLLRKALSFLVGTAAVLADLSND